MSNLPEVLFPPDPKARFAEYGREATRILDWQDHGILRRIWTSEVEIAPGVFRSNQPSHRRFMSLKARGIENVLNLRGMANTIPHLTAKASCDALGIAITPLGFSARHAPERDTLVALIATLKSMPRPFVMHCKSGADRTSFASAIYLNVVMGESMQSAMRMLSLRFVHLKFTATGIMDYILEAYIAENTRSEISFEDWAATHYDGQALQEAFNNKAPIAS